MIRLSSMARHSPMANTVGMAMSMYSSVFLIASRATRSLKIACQLARPTNWAGSRMPPLWNERYSTHSDGMNRARARKNPLGRMNRYARP